MIRATKSLAPLLIAASCAMALAGCGFRSMESGGGAMPEPPAATHPFGLTASPSTPVRATDPDAGAFAALLPDPQNRFSPVSSALEADEDGMAAGLTPDAYVRTIASDGDNGFRVTYVLDGEERKVHLRESDYGTPRHPDSYYVETEDASVRLSSETDSFSGTDKNRGHPDLRYFDVNRLDVVDLESGEHRVFVTYGARTAGDGLPSGKALYLGHMLAQVAERDGRAEAGILGGIVTLTADFEESTLDGAITGLVGVEPEAVFPTLYLTSRFDVEDGEITDGRFTARLTGEDSNPDAVLEETVRGYEGGMLGEFYGPGAEEFGGVLNARSEAHGRVLAGWFGGYGLDANLTLPAEERSVHSVAIERDPPGLTTRRSDARVTAVDVDPQGGMLVTYEIDGMEQQVRFGPADIDSENGAFVSSVGERDFRVELAGTGEAGHWEFDYFEVGNWAVVDHAEDRTVEKQRLGFGLVGAPTPPDALPAGGAAYVGRMYAVSEPMVAGGAATTRTYEGRLELEADFAAGAIEGMIDGIRDIALGEPDPDGLPRRIYVWDGTISGGRFTAELNDDLQDAAGFIGEMNGQFFGPAAVEVGGVLEGTDHVNDEVVHGWFGGTRQPPD